MLKVFLESAKHFLPTVVSQSSYDSLLPLTMSQASIAIFFFLADDLHLNFPSPLKE